jgi:hypothetical protein
MSRGHDRRGPQRHHEAKIDRVPDPTIEPGRPERGRDLGSAGEVQQPLLEAEEIKTADQQDAAQRDRPAEQRQRLDHRRGSRICRLPHQRGQWLPCREQQDQREARAQQISAARDQRRDAVGQHALEGRTRHAAMLDGEHAQQLQVDAKCDERRPDHAGVDALGHDKIADEADAIEK